jgi:type IV pilus assembly protein PilM
VSAILWGLHIPYFYAAAAAGLVLSATALLSRPSAKPTVVGIDVGHSAIKIVEVDRAANPRILRHGITPTPAGCVAEGVVRNPEALIDVLETAMSDAGITQSEVVTVMTGQNLVIQHLDFPRMRESELRAAVADQITQHVPLPADEILYDYQQLPTEREDLSRLLLVATQREPVVTLVQTMRNAGLVPTRVDIEPLAAYRAVFGDEPSAVVSTPKRRARRRPPARDEAPPQTENGSLEAPRSAPEIRVIVDLGAGTSNVGIYKEGVLQLQRVLRVAGEDFTRAIAMSLRIPVQEAEQLKREHGLAEDSPISYAVVPVAESLFREIRLSLEFYHSRNRESRFTDLVLIGGNARLKGLPEQLQNHLVSTLEGIADVSGLRVSLPINTRYAGAGGNPEDDQELFPVLAVALGLALGEVSHVAGH